MSQKLIIQGGKKLQGEVEVRGSKNSATKLMIASLLTDKECTIENIPLSGDIDITKELCERVGSKVIIQEEGHTCAIQTKTIVNSLVPELSRRNRVPVLALGPLLHRKGVAEVPVLGGCPIGHRPINFHLAALQKMGVTLERREHSYYARASRLKGASIRLPFPSVGATENIMLSAVLAQGRTIIHNAAIEPEIENLLSMLLAMGARVAIETDKRVITIEGVSQLGGAKIRAMPDRNEAVSFASAALATKGNILIKDIKREYIEAFLGAVERLGASFEAEEAGIRFFYTKPYHAINVATAPHPGFMTDWQQPLSVVLTQAKGTSHIHETIYEDRFGYTQDLMRMGAKIRVSSDCQDTACRFYGKGFLHCARIQAPRVLRGVDITMKDIRAGMAHIIAALAANGQSVISGIEHIERGYERIDDRLRALGAQIERKT